MMSSFSKCGEEPRNVVGNPKSLLALKVSYRMMKCSDNMPLSE